jgi:hypothetical protein
MHVPLEVFRGYGPPGRKERERGGPGAVYSTRLHAIDVRSIVVAEIFCRVEKRRRD